MSDSDRGYIRPIVDAVCIGAIACFAVLAVWSVASKNAYEQIDAERNASHYASESQDRIKHDCAGLEASAFAECVAKIVETSHEEQRSERDLAAQRGMERWAFWMLIASLSGVLATTVGIFFVKFTLDEARKTTRAALDGARAAEDAVSEAKKTTAAALEANQLLRNEQRPWLSPENFRFSNFNDLALGPSDPSFFTLNGEKATNILSCDFKFDIINSGVKPAVGAFTEVQQSIVSGNEAPRAEDIAIAMRNRPPILRKIVLAGRPALHEMSFLIPYVRNPQTVRGGVGLSFIVAISYSEHGTTDIYDTVLGYLVQERNPHGGMNTNLTADHCVAGTADIVVTQMTVALIT